jgi:hypothetical protein
LSEFATQYLFSMYYGSRDIQSLIDILPFKMFPDLRNNLKRSGLSLYECSLSYSILKRSFAPRILITTSGVSVNGASAGVVELFTTAIVSE